VQRSGHVLSDQPEELARAITGYLEEESITVLTNTDVQEVSSAGDEKIVKLTVDGKETTLNATHLLMATGRQGNTEGLGLENVGLTAKGRGYLPVDETMRTSVSSIFAAGDVTGTYQFVYTAAYEGNLAAENALRGASRKADYSVLPWVIFTDPQVAGIGMDELQAQEAGIDCDTATLTLDNVPRSIAARDTRGFIKLIRNKENDRLVGARILAPEGSELLMELALAMRHRVTVKSLATEFHPYLTLSEGIKLAALTFDKDVKKLSCCAV
jgi:mercuric reductase